MVAGPSRALLEQAIQLRDSGVTLATTAKFRDLLGPDGQVNVSALVYTNIAPLAKSASTLMPERARRATGRSTARPRSASGSPRRVRRSTTPTRSRTASSSPAATRTPWA